MISVVVPVLNESANVDALVGEIVAASASSPIREIVYVDDGSTDDTLARLESLMRDVPMLRVISHARPLGQSAAFLSGARAATQPLLAFIDGDLQNDPADIRLLFRRYETDSARAEHTAVLGQRAVRNDRAIRRISSRLANRVRAAVLKDNTRDTGCSLKLIRRDDFLALPYFNHLHRFLPAMLLRNGVQLAHVEVTHRARVHGSSKYGFWNRALVGAIDLAGAAWLQKRALPADYKPTEILPQVETQ